MPVNKLRANPVTKVEIAGQDVTHSVRRVLVDHEAGRLSVVTLEVYADDVSLNGQPAVPPPIPAE